MWIHDNTKNVLNYINQNSAFQPYFRLQQHHLAAAQFLEGEIVNESSQLKHQAVTQVLEGNNKDSSFTHWTSR